MTIIKCKMCGGDMELSSDKTTGTCQYCGSVMTLPKVDDDQRAAAFDRGNHFRRISEFDKALSVYEHIVRENENDAEAHWCCALCRFGIEYVKDPATGEYLPTCHRASFDSFLEDVDYKAALAHADPIARRQYEQDGQQIAQVQKGILSISQKEEPFDVFICYKESDESGRRTVDSTLAQDIYYRLTEQGRRVFFARITLEDKVGQEYEPYIFAALYSAKVMVVVGTKPEYLNAVWVKNEWSRYLALLKNDRKRLLIPCYRDMDPYDLPEQLSVLQSYDMGKIGFIQDLIRGISKVLDVDKKPEVKETVVVQGEGGASRTALLKRGNMALEDGDWKSADEFFDRVLDVDAECAEAFLGKLLAQEKCSNSRELIDAWSENFGEPDVERLEACPKAEERILAAGEKYACPGYLEKEVIVPQFDSFDRTYPSGKRFRQTELKRTVQNLEADRLFVRARKFAGPELAAQIDQVNTQVKAAFQKRLDEAVRDDQTAVERIRKNYARFLDGKEQKIAQKYEAAVQRRENDYQKACSEMESANTADAFKELHARFVSLDNYKDSAARAADCEQRNNEILAAEAERKAEEDRKAEAARKAAAEARAKRNKKIAIIAAPIAVVVIVCGIILSNMIKANQEEAARQEAYNAAVALVESGDYEDAVDAFEALGDYSDSAEQILNTKYAQALALRDEGSYDQAISILTDLGDFQDSAEQLQATQEVVRLQSQNETLYTEVIDLLERGLLPSEFNMALNKLREISPDYKDTTKINTSLSGAIEDIKALDGIYSYTRKWDGWTVTHSGTFSVSGDSWKYNAISKADNGRIEESNQQSGNMRWSFGWEAETESLTVRYDAEGYNIEDAVFSDAPPSLSMNDNGNLTLENSLWKRQ